MNQRVFVAVLIAMGTWPAGRAAQDVSASEQSVRAQIAQLLSDGKSVASSIKSDIQTLNFFALSAGGPQANTAMLNLYQQHIHDLRSDAARLEAMRAKGSGFQQTAMERMIPVMQELASSAEAAIRTASANQSRLNSSEFSDYFKLNSDLAGELSAVIAAWADYAKTSEDLIRASRKIGSQ